MALVAGQKLRVSDLTGGVSGGGTGAVGGGGVVLPTAVSVTNSTSFVDAMSLAVVAGATYRLDAWLLYSAIAAADFKIQPSSPVGTTGSWSLIGHGRDAAPALDVGVGATFVASDIGTSLTVAGDSTGTLLLAAKAEGVFTTSAAGTFKLRVGQRTANATATILRAGSALALSRLS